MFNPHNSQVIDSSDAKALAKFGAVKIPFLTSDELNEVRTFYEEVHNGKEPPTLYSRIHMTIWHSEKEYKFEIYQRLKRILEAACERTFKNYRAISHQFIVKLPGNETDFPIHQDWSIVDETKHQSFNIWIALQDVDETNGAMWVVKGSHNIGRKIRGPGYLFPDYTGIVKDLRPSMTQYPMNAGEALLFFHSTVHGSPRNLSNAPRVAVQVSVVPKDAPLQIYFQKQEGDSLEIHQPEDNFAFSYERVREDSALVPPTAKATEYKPAFEVQAVTLDEVRQFVIE
jgi:hypothetical protein